MRPPPGQHGAAAVWLPLVLWLVTLLAVVVVDVGGQLLAAARAGALADGAALAAVSTQAPPPPGGPAAGAGARESPAEAARAVAAAGGGRLEHCDCPAGAADARVHVSVPIPGLVWPRLGPGRQVGTADATLVHGPPTAP